MGDCVECESINADLDINCFLGNSTLLINAASYTHSDKSNETTKKTGSGNVFMWNSPSLRPSYLPKTAGNRSTFQYKPYSSSQVSLDDSYKALRKVKFVITPKLLYMFNVFYSPTLETDR